MSYATLGAGTIIGACCNNCVPQAAYVPPPFPCPAPIPVFGATMDAITPNPLQAATLAQHGAGALIATSMGIPVHAGTSDSVTGPTGPVATLPTPATSDATAGAGVVGTPGMTTDGVMAPTPSSAPATGVPSGVPSAPASGAPSGATSDAAVAAPYYPPGTSGPPVGFDPCACPPVFGATAGSFPSKTTELVAGAGLGLLGLFALSRKQTAVGGLGLAGGAFLLYKGLTNNPAG